MEMMESIAQTEMMEHCLRQIRKHPYKKEGLEHYIFLKLLEKCSNSEASRIVGICNSSIRKYSSYGDYSWEIIE